MKTLIIFMLLSGFASKGFCQFDSLMNNYNKGTKDYGTMPVLVSLAEKLKKDSIANVVASDYINHYLAAQPDDLFFRRGNLDLLARYLVGAESEAFSRILHKQALADKVSRPGFASDYIDVVIEKEYINPIDSHPEWSVLKKKISHRFGRRLADRTVLNVQISWYEAKKDTDLLVQLYAQKYEQFGLDTDRSIGRVGMNNIIYYFFFLHSQDHRLLAKAAGWESLLIQHEKEPGFIDTYANLLYKTGKRKEALYAEEEACRLAPGDADIRLNYQKMLAGKPTWNTN